MFYLTRTLLVVCSYKCPVISGPHTRFVGTHSSVPQWKSINLTEREKHVIKQRSVCVSRLRVLKLQSDAEPVIREAGDAGF